MADQSLDGSNQMMIDQMMVDTELLGADRNVPLRMGPKRGNVTTFPFSSLIRPESLGSPAILELS